MLIAPDVSYYQAKVNNSFNRQWLILRCCDGDFLDPNAAFNAGWCRMAVSTGRMRGWTAYVVFRPGRNAAVMANLAKIGALDSVMIDVETWRDPKTGIKAISGDHSAEINQLATMIAAKVGQSRTWIYYNRGDGAEVAPRHYGWLGVVIAGYQSTRPALPGPGYLVGWQYCNAVENHTINPSSTSPFGRCDHNELYVDELEPSGGGTPIGDDMEPIDVWNVKVVNPDTNSSLSAAARLIDVETSVGALVKAVAKLPTSTAAPVDVAALADALQPAIDTAVKAALDRLNVTSTVITTLTEAPE